MAGNAVILCKTEIGACAEKVDGISFSALP